jgi:VanZ family protein
VILLTFDKSPVRWAFRLALMVCVLVISYLAFAPVEQLPETPSDKLDHFLAFAVLAWLADRSFPGRQWEVRRSFLLLGYGLLIELVQYFLPVRECSLLDLAADAAGILCYGAAVRIYQSFRLNKLTDQGL